jgi:hypothetical protein
MFLNEAKQLTPGQYGQLSSKKRMRAPKDVPQGSEQNKTLGGEMAGFRRRLVSRANWSNNPEADPLNIYIEDLQDMNVPVPIDGEVLEIVYIQLSINRKTMKSAERMHLLDYAMKRELPLDYSEYLKLFATSAVRISMAS